MFNSDGLSELTMMGSNLLSFVGGSLPSFPRLIDLLVIVIMLVLIRFIWNKFRYPRGRDRANNPLGLPGKLVYADTGDGAEVFSCDKYHVSAKPDFILRLKNKKYVLVEYKGRGSRDVFESDIIQTKVAVLAARTRWPISSAFVVTDAGHCVKVPLGTDDEIYQSVAFILERARKMKEKGQI